VFLGEHQHTLDAKGRVILPARFRERLANGLVFAPSQERCIDIYPVTVFERRIERLRAIPHEDQRGRAFLRILMAGAHEDRPDAQGRVTIPSRLRDYAHLERDLTVNGMGDRIELWDRGTWDHYRVQAEEDFANLQTPFDL
jgi:MraZ protein